MPKYKVASVKRRDAYIVYRIHDHGRFAEGATLEEALGKLQSWFLNAKLELCEDTYKHAELWKD